MEYQSKTTLIKIAVDLWTRKSDYPLSERFFTAYNVALHIVEMCQMDIVNFSPYSINQLGEESCVAVVYTNNGHTYDDFQRIMKSEVNNNPARNWMIVGISKRDEMIECFVSLKGTDERWDQPADR